MKQLMRPCLFIEFPVHLCGKHIEWVSLAHVQERTGLGAQPYTRSILSTAEGDHVKPTA